MPCRSIGVDPRAVTSSWRSVSAALIFLSMLSSSLISPGREPAAGRAHQITRLDRRDQGTGLGRGQELLRSTREKFQQQPV
jgi:hypothetical protein